MDFYLKYFHGSGRSVDKKISEIESEMKLQETGQIDAQHIDEFHPDEKENGGSDKVIEFPLVNVRKVSYKSARKQISKGKSFDLTLQIKQTKYSSVGNAWKVWDSAIVFSRWIFANSHLFNGKTVHEIGAGCGLSGLTAALFSKEMTLSDYKDEIIENLKGNIELNRKSLIEQTKQLQQREETNKLEGDKVESKEQSSSINENKRKKRKEKENMTGENETTNSNSIQQQQQHYSLTENIRACKLDFEEVARNPFSHEFASNLTNQVDIILGADICYGVHLADWVSIVVDRLLKPDGVFYFCNPKNRWGVEKLISNFEALGYDVMRSTTSDSLSEDFVKKSCWDLFQFTRKREKQAQRERQQNTKEEKKETDYSSLLNGVEKHEQSSENNQTQPENKQTLSPEELEKEKKDREEELERQRIQRAIIMKQIDSDDESTAMPFQNEDFVDTALNFVQSPQAVTNSVLNYFDQERKKRGAKYFESTDFYDLGSGEGRVVIAAAKKWVNFEIRRFVGVEISTDLVNVSKEAAQKEGVAEKCEFEIGDIFTIDLEKVSLILIHHADPIVQKLRSLISKRLKIIDKPCVVATITYPFQNWSHFHHDQLYDIFLYDLTFDRH